MFKPEMPKQEYNGPKVDYTAINRQVKAGQRPARVSLIVDLGQQIKTPSEVEYNPTQKKHQDLVANGTEIIQRNGKEYISVPPKNKVGPEIAVFADLVNDVVDYGEPLGKQPYRIMVNGSFRGDMKGIAFEGQYPYIEGVGLNFDMFTFHAKSQLTALAKATGNTQILSGRIDDANNMDISQLLNGAFYAKIEKSDNGVEGDDGRCYVNYKGANPPPPSFDENGDEVPTKVKETTNTPMIITFDNVTEDTAKFLNGMVVKKIKAATNYVGSKMQQVLEPNYQAPQTTQTTNPVPTPSVAPKQAQNNVQASSVPSDDPFDEFDDIGF